MKYAIRYIALAGITFCGVFFLSGFLHLLFAYNYTHHRFAPALAKPSDFIQTLFMGVGCLAFGLLYRLMVRDTSPVSKH